MQINPNEVIKRGIVEMSSFSMLAQVGIDLSIKEDIVIQDKSALNILLNESIKLPNDVYAQFFVRSSFSRKGIFVTTGVWDPGFEGNLGCTIYNLSGVAQAIEAGTRIGQLICYQADAASTYQGQWQNK